MRASSWLLIAVTVLYLGVAATAAWERDWGKAVVFVGYSIANLGFILF